MALSRIHTFQRPPMERGRVDKNGVGEIKITVEVPVLTQKAKITE